MKTMPESHTIHRCIWISLKFNEFSHNQVWPRSLSLYLAFPAIFRMVLLCPWGLEKRNLRLRYTPVLECLSARGGNDLPSWKLHKWDMSKITWCLSEDRRLSVCSLSTVCLEDRWSLTALFALPGQGGSFPSITLYKTQQIKAPFLL